MDMDSRGSNDRALERGRERPPFSEQNGGGQGSGWEMGVPGGKWQMQGLRGGREGVVLQELQHFGRLACGPLHRFR